MLGGEHAGDVTVNLLLLQNFIAESGSAALLQFMDVFEGRALLHHFIE